MADERGDPWEHDPGPTTPIGRRQVQRGRRAPARPVHRRRQPRRLPGRRRRPPYEPPRAAATAFDRGPPASLARLLLGGEPGFGWPDFAALGVTSHASFGVGRSSAAASATSACWTGRLPTGRGQLPRADLPYGTLPWVGTSGDRAVRPDDLDLGRPSPDYLKLFAPAWVAQLPPAALTAAERAAADQL